MMERFRGVDLGNGLLIYITISSFFHKTFSKETQPCVHGVDISLYSVYPPAAISAIEKCGGSWRNSISWNRKRSRFLTLDTDEFLELLIIY